MAYRILVVDDEPDVLEVLGSLFTMKGYEVIRAKDGMEAATMVAKTRPDLMVLDVAMPKMSGFQTCQTIKRMKDYKDIPVIFLTAKKSEADRKFAEKVGGDMFMTKPYNQNELIFHVEKLLRERSKSSSDRERVDHIRKDMDWVD